MPPHRHRLLRRLAVCGCHSLERRCLHPQLLRAMNGPVWYLMRASINTHGNHFFCYCIFDMMCQRTISHHHVIELSGTWIWVQYGISYPNHSRSLLHVDIYITAHLPRSAFQGYLLTESRSGICNLLSKSSSKVLLYYVNTEVVPVVRKQLRKVGKTEKGRIEMNAKLSLYTSKCLVFVSTNHTHLHDPLLEQQPQCPWTPARPLIPIYDLFTWVVTDYCNWSDIWTLVLNSISSSHLFSSVSNRNSSANQKKA